MKGIFTIILAITSITVIIAVLLQDSKSEGIASLSAESTNIAGQGSHNTKETFLNKIVVGAGIIFMVSALALAIIA